MYIWKEFSAVALYEGLLYIKNLMSYGSSSNRERTVWVVGRQKEMLLEDESEYEEDINVQSA